MIKTLSPVQNGVRRHGPRLQSAACRSSRRRPPPSLRARQKVSAWTPCSAPIFKPEPKSIIPLEMFNLEAVRAAAAAPADAAPAACELSAQQHPRQPAPAHSSAEDLLRTSWDPASGIAMPRA
eukprot:9526711-Alexandrium_andersonii.AAC.1